MSFKTAPAAPASTAAPAAPPAKPTTPSPAAIDRHQLEDVLVDILRAAARRHGVDV